MKNLPENVPILGSHSSKGKSGIELTWSFKSLEQSDSETRSLWRKAICISLLSFIVSIILCIAGVVLSSIRSSASTAAFAADCFLDALTSLIVFWRYYKAIRGKNANENLACVYLGVIIVVSAFAIMAKAVADIITQTEAENSEWLLWLSLSGAVAFILASVAKYWLFTYLLNDSILVDAVNTFLSGLFCVAIAITVLVIRRNPHLWYLDPVEGGVFALFMGVYGIKCIVDNSREYHTSHKSEDNYSIVP